MLGKWVPLRVASTSQVAPRWAACRMLASNSSSSLGASRTKSASAATARALSSMLGGPHGAATPAAGRLLPFQQVGRADTKHGFHPHGHACAEQVIHDLRSAKDVIVLVRGVLVAKPQRDVVEAFAVGLGVAGR